MWKYTYGMRSRTCPADETVVIAFNRLALPY